MNVGTVIPVKKTLLIFCIIFAFGRPLTYADPYVAEIAAGGLTLGRERSVLMEKERLFISEKLVHVKYEFRNTGNKTVSSEVVFPIPSHKVGYLNLEEDFRDFKILVDGKPINVQKEVKAFVGSRDVTDEIRKAGLDFFYTLESSEGFLGPSKQYEAAVNKLNSEGINRLVALGILIISDKRQKTGRPSDYIFPHWYAHTNYYWRQEFPKGKTVRMEIEYRPSKGGEHWMPDLDDVKSKIEDGCFSDNAAITNFKKQHPDGIITASWVSFILTTANTWQTPIKDFELITQGEKDNLITFCWDGKVENIGNGQIRAHKKNFVPGNELKIYFLKLRVPGVRVDS